MKVLILNYEYPPLGGGTGIANQYLLKGFKKQKNLKIDVLSSSVDKYQEEQLSSNIKIIKLNIGKKNSNFHHQSFFDLFRYLIQSSWWVIKNKDQYDLIHAFSGLPGGITALISGKPYIVSLRGGDQPGYEPRLDKYLKPVKPLLKIIYSRAQSIDANSQFLKRLTLKSFPNLKIEVIFNGVDKKVFYPAKKLIKNPVILCTSRFGERKGVKYLVKAMRLVVKKIPSAQLILTGEGVEEKKLKQLVNKLSLKNQIQFKGRVDRQKMSVVYRQASLFVLPSLSESLSNSLLEAMVCGLPVVATKIGGNLELVINRELLVTPADSRALAQAMIKLLKNKNLREKMAKNNLVKAEKFSWQKTAQKYLKIYRSSK